MPRLMYDSVNPFAIPESARMVLVYVDGIFKWSQAGRDRFKHATQVTCSAVGAVTAQVGDVEPGCIWPPADAVPWVQRARRDGYDPTVYVNERNDWAPTREAFRSAGVPEPHWLVANYNGVREIPAGSVGRQYAHPSEPPGNPTGPWHTAGHWDESWVADYWPGVDSTPPPGGGGSDNRNTIGVEDMLIKKLTPSSPDDNSVGTVALVSGGIVSAVDTAWAEETNRKAGEGLIIGVSAEVWDDLVRKSKALESVPELLTDVLAELRGGTSS